MYIVVKFPEENNIVAVVPQSWCDGENVCYWPPYPTMEHVKKASQNREEPDIFTWTQHSAVILKSKDSYEKAHAFMVRAKKGQSLDTEPEDGERRRKRKNNLKYSLDDDDDDVDGGNDDDSIYPPRTLTPKSLAVNPMYLGQQSGGSLRSFSAQSQLGNSRSGQQSGGPGLRFLQDTPAQDFHRLILQHLRKISAEVKELKEQVTRNTVILQSLQSGVNMDISLPPGIVLPLEDNNMLQELEDRLGQSPELTETLVAFFASRGGKSVRDGVRRIMVGLFTNTLANVINWTGAGQKVAFKSLQLKHIVHRAVRKNPITGGTTEEALQAEVSRFLKGASDRLGGWRLRRRREREDEHLQRTGRIIKEEEE
ncbi:hypothetical protein SKAU_G00231170 [Synaphobranchus kaupii]|uniref:DUF4806 domain-containing protein n=1 Tax=Synaphobranchus kaupii TaxID=118154 RepID=A0A9Q1ITC8_SYNKA|nr:hypothetical protein SKAU_G00231170 [Synaphobranchus kaupii]